MLLVYGQTYRFDFVNFDDPDYVTRNAHVREGLTTDSLAWALTSGDAANWFPVTRISHLIDSQLFGIRSGPSHLANVFFHLLATLLLFAFLRRATGDLWPSAFVAFLFAIHPLHAESVAWVSERKDVLSALFWFLTLWSYARYVERPGTGRYLAMAGSLAIGLMAKPMLVTVPFVLLLLDVWPFRRPLQRSLLTEKIPLFALSAAAAVVTYAVQHSSGAVRTLGAFPVGLRIENALVSYVVYIFKMFWPAGLAAFYPYPAAVPVWQAALAGLALAGISLLTLRAWRSRPYLAVGWLWFLGSLLPVIGLVQVGGQARADRYMYVPMAGLGIMLAWGGVEIIQRRPRFKMPVLALAALACVCVVPLTWAQTGYWRNSGTLFQRALDVTGENYLAQHNLGNYLLDFPDRLPEAIGHLREALRIQPNSAEAHTDLAIALSKSGHAQEAAEESAAALRIDPGSAIAHNNLGNGLLKAGKVQEAIGEYQAAIRIQPDYAEAHHNLGTALAGLPGRLPEAIAEYETALRLNPDFAAAHVSLGMALAKMRGRLAEAVAQYQTALRLDPGSAEAHNNLGSALSNMPDRLQDAIAEFRTALAAEPDSAEVHYNLGAALAKVPGKTGEAITHLETALRIRPDYPEAHSNLGAVLAEIPGREKEAIGHFEQALRLRPDYADAHYNLGVALSKIPGKTADAIAHLEAAYKIEPDPQLRDAINQLRGGR